MATFLPTTSNTFKDKDGSWVWILDRGRVITRSADGKPMIMFGTHTDITQRRHDKGYWEQVKSYVTHHTSAQFSHAICPVCVDELYPKQAERIRNKTKE